MANLINFTKTSITIGIIIFGIASIAFGGSTTENVNDAEQSQNRILQFREANFSTWNEKIKYNSTTLNDPKGMAPLYKISNQILDWFLGEDAIPDGKYKYLRYLTETI